MSEYTNTIPTRKKIVFTAATMNTTNQTRKASLITTSYVSHDTASVDSCQPTPLELQQPSLPRLNPITLSELLDGPLEIEWFVWTV